MGERLLFSMQRKEELQDRIRKELFKYKKEIQEQLEKQEEIEIDLLKSISEKILTDEKLKITKVIEKQRRFEEESFSHHPTDYRFYYFEYLILMFADLGEEGLETLESEVQGLDEEILYDSESYDYTSKALAELYLQAYELVKGILYLCKYGLGNNALSLWRTLFEVTTIFLFLREKNSQEISRKFLIHSIYKAEFQITRDIDYSEIKQKFQKEFNNREFFKFDYEWADGYVERRGKSISFNSLYNIQLANFKDFYKEACNYTHSTIFRNMKRYSVNEIIIWTSCLMNKVYGNYSMYLSKSAEDGLRNSLRVVSFHLLYEDLERFINENKNMEID